MKKNNHNFFERLFYNNKFLMVFSLLLAIILWAVVKVNYSDTTTRVLTGIKVSLDMSQAEENGYTAYYQDTELTVNVKVSGRAYNISNYSLKDSDIDVKAVASYVNSPGKKNVDLTAKIEKSGVNIVKIEPASIAVFFDRNATETLNVEARLTNKEKELVADGYTMEPMILSHPTIDVSGPATVLEKIDKVYFDATISQDDLPLTKQVDLDATVTYDLENKAEAAYLQYDAGSQPLKVTIPVTLQTSVKTEVRFVGQPQYFNNNPPEYTITPAKVRITSTSENDNETSNNFTVGTINFSKLKNGVNTFRFADEEKLAQVVDDIEEFTVKVDLSSLSSTVIDARTSNVVFLNQSEDYDYQALLENTGLDQVTLIGPAESLKKLAPEDLQIEINVSSLSGPSQKARVLKITNISISSDEVNDCWVFGEYRARVLMTEIG